ncbi:DUF6452 family protein [Saccharicrinis sp. FJH54]|uniref:DUF6452 family protein n=1 Tax=Saccharicrinis sp. FJH54 TaxID=3344665 RepID=UPI0035D4E41B
MLKNKTHIFFVAGIFALLLACNKTDECNHSTIAGVNYALQKNASSIVNRVIISPFENPDDTLYNSGAASAYIKTLPLSLSSDTTAFLFIAADSIDTTTDIIVFYHSMKVDFLDEACGFVPEFLLDSVKYTGQNIDSLFWLSKNVTTDIEVENIKITY